MTTDPIDCEQALLLLQDYLKQELTPELVAQLEAHFESCRPCFRSRRFEENFVAIIAAKARGQCAPDTVRARVRAAIEAEQLRT